MTEIKKLHEKWMDDPRYRAEYEALEVEFSSVSSRIPGDLIDGIGEKKAGLDEDN